MTDPLDETVELLQRWHAGQRAALDALLDRHLPQLMEFARRSLHAELRGLRREEESMDLVQSAAARVLTYVPPFVPRDGAQFQRLLRTFVRNEIRNMLRSPRVARRTGSWEDYGDSVLDLGASSRPTLNPERAVVKAERTEMTRALVSMALEFLEEDDRRIVQMRQYEELSWERIAQEVGMRADATRMRFQRALVKLANSIRQLREGRIDELLQSTGC